MDLNNSAYETLINKLLQDTTSRETLIKGCELLKIPLHFIDYDEKFKKPVKKGLYIINLGDESNGGSHWTGFYKDKGNFYFDSYSFPASTYLEKYIKPYYYNDEIIQHKDDGRCGLYVLMFGYYLTHYPHSFYKKEYSKKRFEKFLSIFSNKPKDNYNLIKFLFCSIYFKRNF